MSELREDSWLLEQRFGHFLEAYGYATSHFSLAAVAFSKVTPEDAYWIWRTIQLGMEKQDAPSPGFEPESSGPKPEMLPLHHDGSKGNGASMTGDDE